MLELMDVMKQMNLTDIYRMFYPNTQKIYFFLCTSQHFLQTDHTLGHKASLYRYKKVEITPWILLDLYGLKLDINSNRNNRKTTNSQKLDNSLFKENWVKTEIKEKKNGKTS